MLQGCMLCNKSSTFVPDNMKFLRISCLVLFAAFFSSTSSANKYTVLARQANYNTALWLCAERGATLPMPKTQAENNALDAFTSGGGDFYLGLSDAVTEGTWLWADGSRVAWSHWAKTYWNGGFASWEPNGGSSQNYALMLKSKAHVDYTDRWGDSSAIGLASQVVCQTVVTDTVTPTHGPVTTTPTSPYEYIVVEGDARYNNAVQICADLGATLPMPKTQAENDALDALTFGGGYFFLGISDAVTEGVWLWADGSRVRWSNWQKSWEADGGTQPDGGNSDNYALMLKSLAHRTEYSHRWADFSENMVAYRVVCQKTAREPATPPPGPVTATPNSAKEYIVLPNYATHNMAVQLCADRGATLPMPKTQAENDALDALTSEGGTFFLGLSDAVLEGAWLWVDDTGVTWSNWARNEDWSLGAQPSGGIMQNYAIMLKNLDDNVNVESSDRWADAPESLFVNQVVCQMPARVPTQPPVQPSNTSVDEVQELFDELRLLTEKVDQQEAEITSLKTKVNGGVPLESGSVRFTEIYLPVWPTNVFLSRGPECTMNTCPYQSSTREVKFQTNFNQPPEVLATVTRIFTHKPLFKVEVKDVTSTGFKLVCSTPQNFWVENVYVNWVAFAKA